MSVYYTTAEAAELAGLQPQTIRRYCRQGRFKCERDKITRYGYDYEKGRMVSRVRFGPYRIDKRSFRAWLRKPRKCGKRARKPEAQ
jgi:hypothetical protein